MNMVFQKMSNCSVYYIPLTTKIFQKIASRIKSNFIIIILIDRTEIIQKYHECPSINRANQVITSDSNWKTQVEHIIDYKAIQQSIFDYTSR